MSVQIAGSHSSPFYPITCPHYALRKTAKKTVMPAWNFDGIVNKPASP
jgi:hypothetical protein